MSTPQGPSHSTHRIVFGFVSARNGPAQGDPATITYNFVGLFEIPSLRTTNLRADNLTPTRRISSGAQIIAAQPGDSARLIYTSYGTCFEVFEGIPFVEACGQEGDPGAAMLRIVSAMTDAQRRNLKELLA